MHTRGRTYTRMHAHTHTHAYTCTQFLRQYCEGQEALLDKKSGPRIFALCHLPATPDGSDFSTARSACWLRTVFGYHQTPLALHTVLPPPPVRTSTVCRYSKLNIHNQHEDKFENQGKCTGLLHFPTFGLRTLPLLSQSITVVGQVITSPSDKSITQPYVQLGELKTTLTLDAKCLLQKSDT